MTTSSYKFRLLRLRLNTFEVWVGAAAVVSTIVTFFGPKSIASRVVGVVSPGLVNTYTIMYGIGGVCILVGLWRGSPRIESIGLIFVTSGVVVSGIALYAALGGVGLISAILQFGLAIACLVRVRLLVKGQV